MLCIVMKEFTVEILWESNILEFWNLVIVILLLRLLLYTSVHQCADIKEEQATKHGRSSKNVLGY